MSEYCNLTVETVRPEDFKSLDNFERNNLDSPRSLNLGRVARNAVLACQFTGVWNFSIGEYKAVGKEFLSTEEELLKELIDMELLSMDSNEIYWIQNAFFRFFPPR